ncbi:MAG TPA: hypothetical protein VLV49_04610 [Terriglobales bacterium]|nr:hypothetical protein [Terriglobales bacterium]
MRRIVSGIVGVCLLAFSVAAFAQEKTVNVGEVYFMMPKPGMSSQFEQGRKKHMEWHRKNNDTWSWTMFQIMTGDGTGGYISSTFGHTWKDFDTWEEKLGMADAADSEINLVPYLASDTESIWRVMTEVTHPPSSTPPKMLEVLHFMLKPGTESDFHYAISKVSEAIVKANWPNTATWYELVNGGEGPHYVLVIPHDNWADMAEPTPSFSEMLEKTLGRHEADMLMQSFDKTVAREWSEIAVYRPDLSYIAPK